MALLKDIMSLEWALKFQKSVEYPISLVLVDHALLLTGPVPCLLTYYNAPLHNGNELTLKKRSAPS